MINYEKLKEIFNEPVTCEDGLGHYISENNKRYLSGLISQLYQPFLSTCDGCYCWESCDGVVVNQRCSKYKQAG